MIEGKLKEKKNEQTMSLIALVVTQGISKNANTTLMIPVTYVT